MNILSSITAIPNLYDNSAIPNLYDSNGWKYILKNIVKKKKNDFFHIWMNCPFKRVLVKNDGHLDPFKGFLLLLLLLF